MRRNWITLSVLVAFGCSDASLKTFNAEPTATITSHADGEELLEEASTTLQGKVADSDHDEVDLVTTWRVNGEAICEDVAPEEDGTTSCSTTLSTGAVTVALEVSDPGRATGSDSISFTVTPNAPPDVSLTDPFEGERYQAGEAIEFKGRVTDEEDAFDLLTVSIESDLQGALDLNTTLNSEGRFSDFGYLDAGTHIITVTATDSGGKTGRDQEEVEVQPANSAPTIASVEITPDPATTTDTLTCIISGFADADGDGDESTYEWTVNGTAAGTNETLSDAFVSGDEVVCTVTPSDGEDEGEPVSDSIIISNTAPEILDVIIEPGEAITTSTTLTCNATWSDVDGESLEPTYQWTRDDGTDFGTDPVLGLEPLFATPGDVYTCTATVTDGAGASATGADSATVGNTPPEVIEVVITPDTGVSATMTLTCTATADDADGDVPTVTYGWDIEGFDAGTGDALDLSTTGAVSGETVTCTATATDATDATDTGTDSVLIENTAPEVDSVTLSPDPVYTNDTITATATTTDAEDDAVTVTYDWYVNDGLVATGTGDTLSGVTYFDKHDEVYVVTTPSDGTDDGEALTSDTLIVSNTPPTAPTVSVSEELAGTCLAIFPEASRAEADIDCQDRGGYLAWIENEAVNATVNELCSDYVVSFNGSCWLGLEAPWTTWDNGDAVTYTNWYEPTLDGSGPCTQMYSDVNPYGRTGGTWDDTTCGSQEYICRFDCGTGDASGAMGTTALDSGTTDLVCSIDTPSTDADGDPITYDFAWDVDGESHTDTETTTEAGDTVPSDALGSDETWTCEVTPDDGDEDGPYGSDSWTTDPAPVLCTGEDQTDFSYTHFGNGTSAPAFSDQRYLSSSTMEGWHNSVSSPVPAYAAIEFPTPTRVNTLRFSSACDSPRGASFEASNDSTDGVDGTWTALTTDIPSGVCGWTTVSFENESAYTMYRMIESSGIGFVVAEWEMICEESSPPPCSGTERVYDDHSYWFCDDFVSRDEAAEACDAVGMHLVTIGSSAENEFLEVTTTMGAAAHWWMGLTRTDGEWSWDDATPYGFVSWEPGEPESGEDCAEYDGSGSDVGEWNGNECSFPNRYICEEPVDTDGDGYTTIDDCDDEDPDTYPHAGDTYGDGIDSDCDGMDCAGGLIDGIYYVACYNPQTWDTSTNICRDAGYDGLATLTSSTENDFVYGLMPSTGVGTEHLYWIGFNDHASEGDWRWSSGLPVTFTQWGSGEPSDGGGGEDCAHVYGPGMPAHHGEWNDHPCAAEQSFICEAR